MTFFYQMEKTWTFSRLTPDGNEGVGVEIVYLEHTYGTKYYFVDQVNGNINVIHDDNLKESTEFVGCFCPFDLEDLELKVCKITDYREGQDDSRLDEDRRQATQSTPSPQQPSQPKELCPLNELKELAHDSKVFMTEQHTKLYFSHVEIINGLVESYQVYSYLMASQPDLAGEYAVKDQSKCHMRKYSEMSTVSCKWIKFIISVKDPEHVKDLGWVPNDWKYKFNPDHIKVIVGMVPNTLKQISLNGIEVQR